MTFSVCFFKIICYCFDCRYVHCNYFHWIDEVKLQIESILYTCIYILIIFILKVLTKNLFNPKNFDIF